MQDGDIIASCLQSGAMRTNGFCRCQLQVPVYMGSFRNRFPVAASASIEAEESGCRLARQGFGWQEGEKRKEIKERQLCMLRNNIAFFMGLRRNGEAKGECVRRRSSNFSFFFRRYFFSDSYLASSKKESPLFCFSSSWVRQFFRQGRDKGEDISMKKCIVVAARRFLKGSHGYRENLPIQTLPLHSPT